MKLFAHHFRDEVTPRLRNLATAEAVCVVRGASKFSESADAIMHYAIQHGALHLSDEKLRELEDWIADELLAEVLKEEERC